MLSVAEARRSVLQHSRSQSAVRLAAADCLGLILAEPITSDIDSPPFDKAMVDGYAVRAADLIDGHGELEVIEEISAGAIAQKAAAPGQCWRIMTGAPIPAGADAVVMHERTRFVGHELPQETPQFTLDSFREMLTQMRRVGPMARIVKNIPGMAILHQFLQSSENDEEIARLFGAIDAMTPQERRNPKTLTAQRTTEIAATADMSPSDVIDLVKQFTALAEMMRKMSAASTPVRMRYMRQIKGGNGSGQAASAIGENDPGFGRLGRVWIHEDRFKPGQNIMRQGTAMRRGDVLMSPGHRIRPIEIGLLAEVGRTEVAVIPRPSVAVLSTGNELVPPNQIPTTAQIRNSNGPMLAAAIRAAGALPVEQGICRDEPAALREALAEGLRSDVLIVSGGVSAGALDLVPGLLKELGVEEVFHHVKLKPGKPLWFGIRPAVSSSLAPSPSPLVPRPSPLAPTLVFGLPGNPVSSLVCFELFVRPALAQLAGQTVAEELATIPARLAKEFVHRGDRPTFFPAVLRSDRDGWTITALGWAGSGDLPTLAAANALAIFTAGTREYAAGETIECLPLPPCSPFPMREAN